MAQQPIPGGLRLLCPCRSTSLECFEVIRQHVSRDIRRWCQWRKDSTLGRLAMPRMDRRLLPTNHVVWRARVSGPPARTAKRSQRPLLRTPQPTSLLLLLLILSSGFDSSCLPDTRSDRLSEVFVSAARSWLSLCLPNGSSDQATLHSTSKRPHERLNEKDPGHSAHEYHSQV